MNSQHFELKVCLTWVCGGEADVRTGLALRHTVLSGMVQVGDDRWEVTVTTTEKDKEKEKAGTRQWVAAGISNLTHNKATLHSETNHSNTKKWLTACTVLKGSLNILRYGCLFNYYKVSTCHKINDQPAQLEVINAAAFYMRLSIPSSTAAMHKVTGKYHNNPTVNTHTDTLETHTPQTHKALVLVLQSAEVIHNRLPLVE